MLSIPVFDWYFISSTPERGKAKFTMGYLNLEYEELEEILQSILSGTLTILPTLSLDDNDI